uniref:Zinc metalloproteinase n=1 Tax=Panagrellus redivivus TaxID=6233 RepID=A0A7E4VF21_PANRE
MRVLLLVSIAAVYVFGAPANNEVAPESKSDLDLMENDNFNPLRAFSESGIVSVVSPDFEKRQLQRSNLKWDKNTPIRYYFDPPSFNQSIIIPETIKYYETNTCLRFELTTAEKRFDAACVRFIGSSGCNSNVGRVFQKGVQNIRVGGDCHNFKTILHEMGHALGFQHTQCRYDRDQYVKVHVENINNDYLYNYKRLSEAKNENFGLPYDYMSVMHYSQDDFRLDGKGHAMEALNPIFQNLMGTNFELTFIDRKLLNLFYNCPGSCEKPIHCENGGYQDSNNCDRCACPTGFGGSTCAIRAGSDTPTDCGATLKATSEWQSFYGNVTKTCTWWILTENDKHVEIKLESVEKHESVNCRWGGLEVKLDDPLLTGFRVCEARMIPKVPNFVSKDNRAILHGYVNSPNKPQRFAIKYRQV